MATQWVTVFGGTGFLGRRIVRHLHDGGFAVRIASRHPDRARSLFPGGDPRIASVGADVTDGTSVAAAVAGASAVVNAVSLYRERGRHSFRSVHVAAAKRVAELAGGAGAARLVHISGIGADPQSPSSYIRSRGEGERAVLGTFPAAVSLRPSVMFGPGDAFLVPLLGMLRQLPALPLFGSGRTRLQPAFVEDVAEAVVRVLQCEAPDRVYELGGPRVYAYRDLLRMLAAAAGRRPVLVPVPFALWRAIGRAGELLPALPITLNQVELMERDNVGAPGAPGFAALQIVPQSIENVLPQILREVAPAPAPTARG